MKLRKNVCRKNDWLKKRNSTFFVSKAVGYKKGRVSIFEALERYILTIWLNKKHLFIEEKQILFLRLWYSCSILKGFSWVPRSCEGLASGLCFDPSSFQPVMSNFFRFSTGPFQKVKPILISDDLCLWALTRHDKPLELRLQAILGHPATLVDCL